MKKVKRLLQHPLFIVFFLGFLLRVALLFIDYSWDVNNHIAWAKDLWGIGFTNFYNTPSTEVYATVFPNYPPLSLFIFYFIYPLQSILYHLVWWLNLTFPLFPSKLVFFVQNRAFMAGLFKIPSIFADLGIAYMSYLFAKKIVPTKKRLHLFIIALMLFNPAFFYNSAFWGQIDAIPIFFVLTSLYLLLLSKRYVLSGVLLTGALLVKPTILVYVPIYLLFIITSAKPKDFIKTLIIAIVVFWLSFVPFVGGAITLFTPFQIYIEKILSTQSLPYVTNGAFNFWILITYFTGIKDTAIFMFGLSYRMWGYGLTGSCLLIIIYYSFKANRDKTYQVFFALALVALAGFLFLTKMHERYSMLPLPFLLLLSIKDRSFLRWFILFSVMSFFNLYHSWPVPPFKLLQDTLNNPVIVITISSLNVFVFLYLLKRYIECCRLSKKK